MRLCSFGRCDPAAFWNRRDPYQSACRRVFGTNPSHAFVQQLLRRLNAIYPLGLGSPTPTSFNFYISSSFFCVAIISCLTQNTKWDPPPTYLSADVRVRFLPSFNTRGGMTCHPARKTMSLSWPGVGGWGILRGLAEPGAALMPGSMTLSPPPPRMPVCGSGQLMIYLRSRTALSCKPFPSLSGARSCVAFVIPPCIKPPLSSAGAFLRRTAESLVRSFIKTDSSLRNTLCISAGFPFEAIVETPNQRTPLTANLNINAPAKNHRSSLTGASLSPSNLCLASVRELYLSERE